jgi:dual specificity tyrosine-phosphorylation-regulated kinase 2/3/4
MGASSSTSAHAHVVGTTSSSEKAAGSPTVWSPAEVIEKYKRYLTAFETDEIRKFSSVYFFGPSANKIQASEDKPHNFGYDDENNRYKCVKGDHINYRYEVIKGLGKGSFGDVVKTFDHKTKKHVAVKIIRNERRFHKQAQYELKLLDFLRKQDKHDTHNVIHMHDHFVFRNHLCITFELLHQDLYTTLKKNDFKGFSLSDTRRFTTGLLQALRVLRRSKIIHCDLKPENIMLRDKEMSGVKIIDFGSSCYETERIHTYIQSRFYRAPEVILNIGYGSGIDMWSLGCIMAELHTGQPLFPGHDEREQLMYHMELLGVPSAELLAEGKRSTLFFDPYNNPKFSTDHRGVAHLPQSRSLQSVLGSKVDVAFLDFIQRCLALDPRERMTPGEALKHPFITQIQSTTVTAQPVDIAAAANAAPALPRRVPVLTLPTTVRVVSALATGGSNTTRRPPSASVHKQSSS